MHADTWSKTACHITGARWGLSGTEAVLKLRAVRPNGDLDNYWTWHEQQEFIATIRRATTSRSYPPPDRQHPR